MTLERIERGDLDPSLNITHRVRPGAGEKLLRAWCGVDTALPDGQADPGLTSHRTRAPGPTTSSPPSPNIGTSREKPIRPAYEYAATVAVLWIVTILSGRT